MIGWAPPSNAFVWYVSHIVPALTFQAVQSLLLLYKFDMYPPTTKQMSAWKELLLKKACHFHRDFLDQHM